MTDCLFRAALSLFSKIPNSDATIPGLVRSYDAYKTYQPTTPTKSSLTVASSCATTKTINFIEGELYTLILAGVAIVMITLVTVLIIIASLDSIVTIIIISVFYAIIVTVIYSVAIRRSSTQDLDLTSCAADAKSVEAIAVQQQSQAINAAFCAY